MVPRYPPVSCTGEDGLPFDDFTTVAAGEPGVVWFGTTNGAIRYDGTTWQRSPPFETGFLVTTFGEDEAGDGEAAEALERRHLRDVAHRRPGDRVEEVDRHRFRADLAQAAGTLVGWVNNAAVFHDAWIHAAPPGQVLDLIAANLNPAVVGCATRHRSAAPG